MTENGQKFEVEKSNSPSVPVTQEPKKDISKLDFQEQITHLIPTAGTIELSKSQRDILYDPVKDDDVEIRPDGLIYLPWMEYVSRLKDAFGIGWAIIPQGMPTAKGDYVLWPFWLVIQGKIAGFAVGEQQYYANNPTMTYGDALEGAKSNALMRLCKGIGISLELWKPSFIRAWKEKYSESFPAVYPDGKPKVDKNGKQKTEWRKKGQSPNEKEEDQPEPEKVQPEYSANYLVEVIKHMDGAKNFHELRNSFTKHSAEWKSNLLPADFIRAIEYKDALKKKLEEVK